jgi:hypothetical protein
MNRNKRTMRPFWRFAAIGDRQPETPVEFGGLWIGQLPGPKKIEQQLSGYCQRCEIFNLVKYFLDAKRCDLQGRGVFWLRSAPGEFPQPV